MGHSCRAPRLLDEGTEKVLDILQEKACVNTLFLAKFTYGNGIASRQLKGYPLPDHGVQAYDENFHGGNYATPHSQYYKNTVIQDTKAPDHGNLDILETVIPVARKRGVKGRRKNSFTELVESCSSIAELLCQGSSGGKRSIAGRA